MHDGQKNHLRQIKSYNLENLEFTSQVTCAMTCLASLAAVCACDAYSLLCVQLRSRHTSRSTCRNICVCCMTWRPLIAPQQLMQYALHCVMSPCSCHKHASCCWLQLGDTFKFDDLSGARTFDWDHVLFQQAAIYQKLSARLLVDQVCAINTHSTSYCPFARCEILVSPLLCSLVLRAQHLKHTCMWENAMSCCLAFAPTFFITVNAIPYGHLDTISYEVNLKHTLHSKTQSHFPLAPCWKPLTWRFLAGSACQCQCSHQPVRSLL